MSTQSITHHENGHTQTDNDALSLQAAAWLRYVRAQCDRQHLEAGPFLEERKRRALHFTEAADLPSLAVPFELVGTRPPTLRALHRQDVPFGLALNATEYAGTIAITRGDHLLGYVPASVAVWLEPLVMAGATVHLVRITGREQHYAQVYAIGFAAALRRVGDSPAVCNGQAERGASAGVESTEVIRLWRDARGTARASIPHVVRHSPTGIEWGYGGSGPSDLAYSILCYVLEDEDAARRFHLAFKEEIVAGLPREGCELPVAAIRQWLCRRQRS